MSWVEVFAVLVVSHLVGDYLLQTDWQARHKRGGLGADPIARRALVLHVVSYTIAFVPALIWLRHALGIGGVIGVAALVFIPHLIQDDGRLLMRLHTLDQGLLRADGCGDLYRGRSVFPHRDLVRHRPGGGGIGTCASVAASASCS